MATALWLTQQPYKRRRYTMLLTAQSLRLNCSSKGWRQCRVTFPWASYSVAREVSGILIMSVDCPGEGSSPPSLDEYCLLRDPFSGFICSRTGFNINMCESQIAQQESQPSCWLKFYKCRSSILGGWNPASPKDDWVFLEKRVQVVFILNSVSLTSISHVLNNDCWWNETCEAFRINYCISTFHWIF